MTNMNKVKCTMKFYRCNECSGGQPFNGHTNIPYTWMLLLKDVNTHTHTC